MFRDREVTMRLRKTKDSKTQPQDIPMKEDRLPAYTKAAQKIMLTGVAAVYGYVLVDTYRQKTVAKTICRNQNR